MPMKAFHVTLLIVILGGSSVRSETAKGFVDSLEDFASDIETLCSSGAASLPDVDSFCEFALQGEPPVSIESFHLTPVNFGGCMQAESSTHDSGLEIQDCDMNEPLQKFKYDGEMFTLASDETLCLQAGRSNEPPVDGGMLRLSNCDPMESLQMFDWPSETGGSITPVAYPDFCIVSRGVTVANGDTIITKLCSGVEAARRDGWKKMM